MMSAGRKILYGLSALPFLLFLFLWGMAMYDRSLREPSGVEHYRQWEKRFGQPKETILRFKKGGRIFYQVTGPIPTSWGGNGEPAYIFDSTGRFCDWTPDLSEGSDYYLRWPVMRLDAQPLPYRAFIRLLPPEDL